MFESEVERGRRRLNSLFGDETFLAFRDDMRNIYLKHRDFGDVSAEQKRKWVRGGRRGLEETRQRYLTFETGLNTINALDAAFSFVFGAIVKLVIQAAGATPNASIVIGIVSGLFLYSLNTGLVFAKALVSEIAYKPEEIHTRLSPTDLRFRAGWNRGVLLSTPSMLGIIIYGIITHPGSKGYELGLQAIEEWFKQT